MLYSFLVHLVNPLLTLFNGRPDIQHLDRLPKGNYVLIAPHRSWMDPVLLALALYPKKFTFMAKKELFSNRFVSWFLRKLGAYPVDRLHPGPSVIGKPVKLLRKTDLSTIIFPSGSRYSSKLKGGAILIAKMAGVPMVPAVYQGPFSLGGIFGRRKRHINFGEPIYLDRKQKLTEELQAEIEKQMQDAFDKLDREIDPEFHYAMPEKPADDHF